MEAAEAQTTAINRRLPRNSNQASLTAQDNNQLIQASQSVPSLTTRITEYANRIVEMEEEKKQASPEDETPNQHNVLAYIQNMRKREKVRKAQTTDEELKVADQTSNM